MELPLIGIMIPTHQDAATLARCLDSVLEQDYPNLMVMALDNHSSDGTYDILVDFEKRYRDRLYVGRTYTRLSRTDQRIRCAQALNPRTRIIQYLSATDALAPGFVSRCQQAFAADESVGCVAAHADVLNADGTLRRVPGFRPADAVIPAATQMESFMADGMDLKALTMFRVETYALSGAEGWLFNRFPDWLPLIMASSIAPFAYIRESLGRRGDPAAVLGDRWLPDTEELFEHYLFLQAFSTIALRLGRTGVAERLPQALRRLSLACIGGAQLLRDQGALEKARAYLSLALTFLPEMAASPEFQAVAQSFEAQPLDWQ